uniref:Dynactin subunit 6 n=1 Tax=Felis catus TaxID=9685 RepID=A0ABI7YKV8_FELCA
MAEKAQKSVKIAPGAVVCVESEIRGDVTIGPRTVIHPKARIIAEAGPIVIGEGNLIEEQALIINAICGQKRNPDKWLHHWGLL